MEPITRLADDLSGRLMDSMLADIGTEVETELVKVGKKVTGGDLRLSRYGRGGKRGGTRMTVTTRVAGDRATIDMEPPGMWALAVGGASAHYIGKGSRTKAGKPRKRHPGARPQGSLDAVYSQVPDICLDVIDEALAKAVK